MVQTLPEAQADAATSVPDASEKYKNKVESDPRLAEKQDEMDKFCIRCSWFQASCSYTAAVIHEDKLKIRHIIYDIGVDYGRPMIHYEPFRPSSDVHKRLTTKPMRPGWITVFSQHRTTKVEVFYRDIKDFDYSLLQERES